MWCRFHAIKDHLVEFNQVAIEAADGSHDMINRVMTKDNIGLALLLETNEAVWTNGKCMLCFRLNATVHNDLTPPSFLILHKLRSCSRHCKHCCATL